jgi:5-methylcytosine-specific restriction protein B
MIYMSKNEILTWGDVAYAARIYTAGFDHEREALEWMWQSWEMLIQSGLATYTNIELSQVVLRFLALISFLMELYDDWYNYESYYDGQYWYIDLIQKIKVNDFSFDDFIEYIEYFHYDYIESFYYDYFDVPFGSKYNDLNPVILKLIKESRQEIEPVLLNTIGSESLLDKSIFTSIKKKYEDNCLNEEYDFYTDDFEKDISSRKIAELTILYETMEKNDYDYDFSDPGTTIIKGAILINAIPTDIQEIEEVMSAAEQLAQFFSYPKPNRKYTIGKCAEETGFAETELEQWVRAINRKGQAIIYGSPGTGKTFIAEKLAEHLMSGYGFSELVQFHPAYSYEDFIQGIRPQSEDGKLTYPLVPGRFLEFCKKAESFQDTCVLIIDEINRANLAQVFGELMYLLEYRDKEIPLAGGNTFRIPKNVRIIGTMNTADRSITQFDYALRRRFAFIELRPNYDVLRRYHLKTGFAVEGLIQILERLNQAIADKNYEIGISFFLTDNLREDIEDIWCMEIEPYLEEYFFNQLDKVDEFRWNIIQPNLKI